MTSINYQPLLNSSTNLKILLQNQNADGTISSLFSGSEPEDVLAAKAIFNQQPGSDGEVNGPASATDNAVARFDGTTGKLIQNSTVTIDDSGNITPSSSVHGANGSASNPSFAFNSDQNTGLYRIGADNIGVAANGAKVLDIATTGLTVTGAVTATGTLTSTGASQPQLSLTKTGSGAGTFSIYNDGNSHIASAGGTLYINNSSGAAVNFGGAATFAGAVADQGGTIAAQRNGLASAQGLAFNGTGRATATLGTAVGTLDYTFRAKIKVAALTSAHQTAYTLGPANAMLVRPTTGYILDEGGAYSVGVVAGITSDVAIVRTGGVSYLYINGLLKDQHANTYDFSSSTVNIGAEPVANADPLTGVLSDQLIYNRALSAAEVLALYQSGAPAAADYPSSPAGTVVTKTVTLGTWTGSVAGSTYTVSTASTAFINGGLVAYGSLPRGKIRINYNLTINSGPGPAFGDGNAFTSSALVAGTSQSVEFANPSAGNQLFLVNNYAAGNYVVTINSVTVLGLLLAPDSAQVGGGLTWYDASGNAANITLPAEGVSWSLPTSGKAFSLSLASTTAGSSGAGALVVQGGISAGQSAQASYFGGTVAAVAGSSATPSSSNSAMWFSASGTATNFAGIYLSGSTTYNSFFGRVPIALSGENDAVGLTCGNALIQKWNTSGVAVTGTLTTTGAATFAGAVGAPSITSPAANNLTLGTTSFGTALTVVSSNGQVGIGTTTPGDRFVVSNAGAAGLEFGVTTWVINQAYNRSTPGYVDYEDRCLNRIFSTNGSTEAMRIASTGAVRFNAYTTGTAMFDSAGNITSVSDARLKNITGTFTKGLAEIVKLTPKLYTWKPETGLVTDDINATLIAQDLIAAGLPEAVSTYRTVPVMENDVQSAEDIAAGKPVTQHAKLDADGKPVTKRVDSNYSVSDRTVIAALVNAVKELKAEIDALKAAK